MIRLTFYLTIFTTINLRVCLSVWVLSIVVIAAYLGDLYIARAIRPHMHVLFSRLDDALHVLHEAFPLSTLEITDVVLHAV